MVVLFMLVPFTPVVVVMLTTHGILQGFFAVTGMAANARDVLPRPYRSSLHADLSSMDRA